MYRTNVLRFAHILLPLGGFILLTILSGADSSATDLSTMKKIGPVASFAQTPTGVTLRCEDDSQVQIFVLAPGIIRVRAAFAHSLPETDHSWAVPFAARPSVVWQVAEKDGQITLTTPKIEVSIQKIPLLIEFREASTHAVLNADMSPMMFDVATGNIAAAKKLGIDEHFYGLGEKAAHLNKRRQAFTMWNTDNATYIEGSDPLYQRIPFYIGLQGNRAYGIFFDNSFRSSFDLVRLLRITSASAEGGELNYYFFNGPEIKRVLREYGELTGFMTMPPIWSLGNQQSRYSYYPSEVAQAVVDRFRKDDLPLDVLFLDIDYMNQYRVFTWNTERFPDPLALANSLKANGVKIVVSIDPRVAYQLPIRNIPESSHPELDSQNESYYVFNQGTRRDYFLKRKSGEIYHGKVWPEKVVFPDFTMDSVRAWSGGLYRALTGNGVQGVWNDMNEPSDFSDGDGKNKSDVVSYDEGQYTSHCWLRRYSAIRGDVDRRQSQHLGRARTESTHV